MTTGTDPIYRVVQVGTGVAGSPYYITGYFWAAGGTAQAAATAWRNAIGNAVGNFVQPYQYLAITNVDTVDPVTGNTIGVTPVTVPAITFTSTDDPLPPASSLLLRWRTGIYVGGREIRGRTNIPRLGETANTAGVVDAASVTAWNARVTTLIAGGTFNHVVYSKKNGLYAFTLSGSASPKWAVLRSRRD